MAAAIAVDSKAQYPAACNAAEVLLVHEAFAESSLSGVAASLEAAGVRLDLDPRSAAALGREPTKTDGRLVGRVPRPADGRQGRRLAG